MRGKAKPHAHTPSAPRPTLHSHKCVTASHTILVSLGNGDPAMGEACGCHGPLIWLALRVGQMLLCTLDLSLDPAKQLYILWNGGAKYKKQCPCPTKPGTLSHCTAQVATQQQYGEHEKSLVDEAQGGSSCPAPCSHNGHNGFFCGKPASKPWAQEPSPPLWVPSTGIQKHCCAPRTPV